jgi:hypothetical protein
MADTRRRMIRDKDVNDLGAGHEIDGRIAALEPVSRVVAVIRSTA